MDSILQYTPMFPSECFFPTYELSFPIWGATSLAQTQETQIIQTLQLAQSPVLMAVQLFCALLKHYMISGIGFKVSDKCSAEQNFAFALCRFWFTFIATCEVLNNTIVHLILYFLTLTEISFPEIDVYCFLVFVNRRIMVYRTEEINSQHTR